MDNAYDVILKNWRSRGGCSKSRDGRHWARYVFQGEEEQEYWLKERIDEANNCWWRHYEFMSIPCSKCGAYSPLRCDNQFSTNLNGELDKKSCSPEKIIDYHPDDVLPDTILRYKEKGWSYYFFVETLSDSLCGQETFTLKRMPEQPSFLEDGINPILFGLGMGHRKDLVEIE